MAILTTHHALRFLVEAGRALAESLELEPTLEGFARLIIPRFSDWSAIHLLDGEGELRRAATAHPDPEKLRLCFDLYEKYPIHRDGKFGVAKAVRTGEPELLARVTEEDLAKAAKSPEHLAILRGLGLRSSLIIPLMARGRSLGAMSLVMAESGRNFDGDDLELAVELGQRLALAVDNARLFRETRRQANVLGRTEGDLRQAQDLLRSALSASDVAVTAQDLSGRFLFANDAQARLLDFADAAELMATPQAQVASRVEVLHEDGRPLLPEEWASAIARKGESVRHRVMRVKSRRTGEERWYEVQAIPVRDEAGSLRLVVTNVHEITRLKQAEEALRAGEERYRLALDAGRIGVWEWDIRTGIITWSDRVYEMHGLARGEYPGTLEGFKKLIHPDDVARVGEEIRKAVEEGAPYQTEFRVVHPSGAIRWIATSARMERAADGSPMRLIGATVDVTDRRRTDEALRKSETLYRAVTENTPQLTWMSDASGRSLFYNRQWSEFTGRTIRGGEEQANLDIIHPDDLPAMMDARARSIAAGGPYVLEFRVRRADGAWRWHLARVAPVLGEDGKLEFWFGSATDVDDLRRAQEGLRKSEEEFRAMFQLAGSGKMQADLATGRFLRVNHKFSVITGRTEAELRDMAYPDIVYREDRAAVESMLEDIRKGKKRDWYAEIRYTRKDGTLRWVQVTGTVLAGMAGDPERLLATVHDVTERKLAEEEAKSSQEKFRQSQKLESIGRLAGGIAHDFNNLLTAINGYADLLLMQVDEASPFSGYVKEIRQSGERAASLTRQLLAYSRRQIMAPRVADLNSIVMGLTNMLGRLIGEQIDLKNDLDPALPKVKVDPGQMEQVILNLAVNARDAMPDGGALVIRTAARIQASPTEAHDAQVPAGRYAALVLEDTGHGMDKDVMGRLFEPFFTTKEVGKGTGLGLSMVHGIIRQSDGYIQVESAPGRGSRFTILLPALQDHAHSEPAEHAVRPAATRSGERATVLLVEDEESVRRYVREILAQAGYQVIEAENGDDAVRVSEGFPEDIHIMVSDVVMPGVTGPQAAQALAGSRPKMRVLFMSGYSDASILRYGILGDKGNFLQKPFSPSDLLAKVREILAAQPA